MEHYIMKICSTYLLCPIISKFQQFFHRRRRAYHVSFHGRGHEIPLRWKFHRCGSHVGGNSTYVSLTFHRRGQRLSSVIVPSPLTMNWAECCLHTKNNFHHDQFYNWKYGFFHRITLCLNYKELFTNRLQKIKRKVGRREKRQKRRWKIYEFLDGLSKGVFSFSRQTVKEFVDFPIPLFFSWFWNFFLFWEQFANGSRTRATRRTETEENKHLLRKRARTHHSSPSLEVTRSNPFERSNCVSSSSWYSTLF